MPAAHDRRTKAGQRETSNGRRSGEETVVTMTSDESVLGLKCAVRRHRVLYENARRYRVRVQLPKSHLDNDENPECYERGILRRLRVDKFINRV